MRERGTDNDVASSSASALCPIALRAYRPHRMVPAPDCSCMRVFIIQMGAVVDATVTVATAAAPMWMRQFSWPCHRISVSFPAFRARKRTLTRGSEVSTQKRAPQGGERVTPRPALYAKK